MHRDRPKLDVAVENSVTLYEAGIKSGKSDKPLGYNSLDDKAKQAKLEDRVKEIAKESANRDTPTSMYKEDTITVAEDASDGAKLNIDFVFLVLFCMLAASFCGIVVVCVKRSSRQSS